MRWSMALLSLAILLALPIQGEWRRHNQGIGEVWAVCRALDTYGDWGGLRVGVELRQERWRTNWKPTIFLRIRENHLMMRTHSVRYRETCMIGDCRHAYLLSVRFDDETAWSQIWVDVAAAYDSGAGAVFAFPPAHNERLLNAEKVEIEYILSHNGRSPTWADYDLDDLAANYRWVERCAGRYFQP